MNDDLWTLPGPERSPFGGNLAAMETPAGPAQVASCAGLAAVQLGPLPQGWGSFHLSGQRSRPGKVVTDGLELRNDSS